MYMPELSSMRLKHTSQAYVLRIYVLRIRLKHAYHRVLQPHVLHFQAGLAPQPFLRLRRRWETPPAPHHNANHTHPEWSQFQSCVHGVCTHVYRHPKHVSSRARVRCVLFAVVIYFWLSVVGPRPLRALSGRCQRTLQRSARHSRRPAPSSPGPRLPAYHIIGSTARHRVVRTTHSGQSRG